MAKKVLVVESPSKAKTLKKYLGRGFDVLASMGHVKDLPTSKLGVDIERGFKPHYVILKGKREVLKKIKEAAKKAEVVYLGSDPDREGEAIAFHIAQEIGSGPEIKRVLFYEITKEEVKRAVENPEEINMDRVYAQQARRILDRLVGYKVSPFLWKVIRRGLSAGRVQTVALRLLCEREEKIRAFVPEVYWVVSAILEKDGVRFKALLKGKKGEKAGRIKSEEEAKKILEELEKSKFIVEEVRKTEKKIKPPPPYKTSTMQQDAASKLGFSAKYTMMLAQELYEGVDLPEGRLGLITYMRTDSVRMADRAIASIREIIASDGGEEYLPPRKRVHGDRGKVQGAHEAVRPTYPEKKPETLRGALKSELFRLYNLIWRRAVASQAKEALQEIKKVSISASDYILEAEGKKLLFDGFYRFLGEKPSVVLLPELASGDEVKLVKLELERKQTEPPRRYTEATLIQALEAKGIGRPSTYAPTISTLYERKYMEREGRYLKPTELGELVNRILIPRFPEIFDVGFTARMEEELDKVEEGTYSWQELLKDFYERFKAELEKVQNDVEDLKKETMEVTEEKCPLCGRPLVIRWGRYGKFLACSGYPECKYTKPLDEELTDEKCPVCGKPMVVRYGKNGRFLACIDYPKCPGTKPYTTGIKCPRCGKGELIERRSKKGKIFYGCSRYPECDFVVWGRPVEIECPSCGFPILVEKKRGKSTYYSCPSCGKNFKKKDLPEEKLASAQKSEATR